jgi:hypothetical protein
METLSRIHARLVAERSLRVFTIAVRALLALAFVPSGLVKIMDEPFTRLPVSDPVGYFFAGFFSAHGYYRFVGVAQWTAAALLLAPRTATLGAFLYLPIIVNIFAITVALGPSFAGTRYITGAMLLGNLYLLAWDWDRWKPIVSVGASGRERHGDWTTVAGLLMAAGLGFAGVTGVHLARLRHETYLLPIAMLTAGGLIGVLMLVRAYRRSAPENQTKGFESRPTRI